MYKFFFERAERFCCVSKARAGRISSHIIGKKSGSNALRQGLPPEPCHVHDELEKKNLHFVSALTSFDTHPQLTNAQLPFYTSLILYRHTPQ